MRGPRRYTVQRAFAMTAKMDERLAALLKQKDLTFGELMRLVLEGTLDKHDREMAGVKVRRPYTRRKAISQPVAAAA